jgi:hypothetical protein
MSLDLRPDEESIHPESGPDAPLYADPRAGEVA